MNPRPYAYKAYALPAELKRQHIELGVPSVFSSKWSVAMSIMDRGGGGVCVRRVAIHAWGRAPTSAAVRDGSVVAWHASKLRTTPCGFRARGVVVSHPLSMRKALGSIPSASMRSAVCRVCIPSSEPCGGTHAPPVWPSWAQGSLRTASPSGVRWAVPAAWSVQGRVVWARL